MRINIKASANVFRYLKSYALKRSFLPPGGIPLAFWRQRKAKKHFRWVILDEENNQTDGKDVGIPQ